MQRSAYSGDVLAPIRSGTSPRSFSASRCANRHPREPFLVANLNLNLPHAGPRDCLGKYVNDFSQRNRHICIRVREQWQVPHRHADDPCSGDRNDSDSDVQTRLRIMRLCLARLDKIGV